jgi:ketosteroid isomerase-like protein
MPFGGPAVGPRNRAVQGDEPMPRSPYDVQRLLDIAEIRDVIARYFQGIDRGDLAQVRDCFTADVRAVYHQWTPVAGIHALMERIESILSDTTGPHVMVRTHFMGNFNIDRLQNPWAETETNVLSYKARLTHGKTELLLRGTRYLDRLRREEDGWRICERVHALDWSCTEPSDYAVNMAQRFMRLPALEESGPAGTA